MFSDVLQNAINQSKLENPALTSFEIKLDLLTEVWNQLNQLAVDDVDNSPDDDGNRIASVIQRLFPNGANHIELRWLPDLLNPDTVHRFSVAVNQDHYDSLRFTAFHSKDDEELSEAHRQHLTKIANGHMPFGVFSDEHSRWRISDCNEPDVVCNQYAVDQYMKK